MTKTAHTPPASSALAAWDIGGAHLKLALLSASGDILAVEQWPAPTWQGPGHLEQALDTATRAIDGYSPRHVITMTAELADCFTDRADGVRQVTALLEARLASAPIHYYSAQGLLAAATVRTAPLSVASVNWHATLEYVAGRLETGMLIDVGGTTTDLLPFSDGQGLTLGGDDLARMRNGELLYSGVVRTPVHALADALPWRGAWQPLAAERFADTADIYRLLGRLQAHQDVLDTADGRDRDTKHSARRLARMIGTDLDMHADPAYAISAWQTAARYLEECQLRQVHAAAARVLSRHPELHGSTLVVAGAGAFLAEQVAVRLDMTCVQAVDLLGAPAALRARAGTCTSALALARLAQEQNL